MEIVSGVSYLTIDGVSYSVPEDLVKFEMATINREPVVGKDGSIFLKETPQPAKLSFSVLVPGSVDVSSFNARRSSNIVVKLANGFTLNANGFASSGANDYDSAEGKLALEWFGPKINLTQGS